MIRVLIVLGVAGWVGYFLLPAAEQHQPFDPLRNFVSGLVDHAPSDTRGASERISAEKPHSHRLNLMSDAQGQFSVECRVSNVAMLCNVDTGASAAVTLDRIAADRIGLNVAKLQFTARTATANGAVRTAETRVATLRVGPFVRTDVPVTVVDSDMDGKPLLGMAFLRQYKVVMANDLLTLSE